MKSKGNGIVYVPNYNGKKYLCLDKKTFKRPPKFDIDNLCFYVDDLILDGFAKSDIIKHLENQYALGKSGICLIEPYLDRQISKVSFLVGGFHF